MLLTMNPVLLPCGVHVYSGESSWLCPSVCQFVCLYMWNVSFRFRSPFEGKYTFMAVTTLYLSLGIKNVVFSTTCKNHVAFNKCIKINV